MAYFFSTCGTPTSRRRGVSMWHNNRKVIEMENKFKKFLALNFYSGRPLKYRESAEIIYELEKRLTAEVNGYGRK
jgi:hypothetical protein